MCSCWYLLSIAQVSSRESVNSLIILRRSINETNYFILLFFIWSFLIWFDRIHSTLYYFYGGASWFSCSRGEFISFASIKSNRRKEVFETALIRIFSQILLGQDNWNVTPSRSLKLLNVFCLFHNHKFPFKFVKLRLVCYDGGCEKRLNYIEQSTYVLMGILHQ